MSTTLRISANMEYRHVRSDAAGDFEQKMPIEINPVCMHVYLYGCMFAFVYVSKKLFVRILFVYECLHEYEHSA